MSDCRSYQDEMILGIYGEGDSPHGDVCPRCSDLREEYTEVLRFYRSAREPVAPPPLEIPRRVTVGAIAIAAGLLILAVLTATHATRVKPAYALTDREIFWTLSRIHQGADAVAGAGFGYEEGPFLEDLEAEIRDARHLPETPWEIFPEDPMADEIDALNRRIVEIRREMEEWI